MGSGASFLKSGGNPAGNERISVPRLVKQVSKVITGRKSIRNAGKGNNMQEEANSFRSKSGTIKMLIKNKNSRKAFFTFLEKTQPGKEEMLDYFLFIEGIKKSKAEVQKQFIDVIAKYEKLATGKDNDSPEAIILASTHTWKDITTLPPEELCKHMSRSQDEVLIALTPLFESFLLSNYYKEFDKNEKSNERRSYISSAPLD
jgi:hypothetical protein